MKSQRRHELQQNTLSVELSQVGQWVRNNGTRLALGALVVALLVLVGTYIYRSYRDAAIERTYLLYTWLSGSEPAELDDARKQELAQEDGLEGVMATYLLGRDRMTASFQEMFKGDSDPEKVRQLRDEAQDYFQATLDQAGDHPVLAAQARYSLTVIYEDRGEYVKALEQCKALQQMDQVSSGYWMYQWARDKEDALERAMDQARTARMVPSTPLRQIVRARAQGLLGMLAGGSVEDVKTELAPEAQLDGKIEDLADELALRPAIYDLHVGADKSLIVTETIEEEQDKPVMLLLTLARQAGQERWLLEDLRSQPGEQALAALEEFRKENP
jgi:tetratricopeptide (TPR) repeat protein